MTSGGAPAAGASMHGTDAGNVTITGSADDDPGSLQPSGLITANGGAALGLADGEGERFPGAIAIPPGEGPARSPWPTAISALSAAMPSTGVGAGGAAKQRHAHGDGQRDRQRDHDRIRCGLRHFRRRAAARPRCRYPAGNVSLGAITGTGGLDGNGGAVTVNAGRHVEHGGVTNNGGAGTAGTAGGNGGTISLTSSGTLSTGALTATGRHRRQQARLPAATAARSR